MSVGPISLLERLLLVRRRSSHAALPASCHALSPRRAALPRPACVPPRPSAPWRGVAPIANAQTHCTACPSACLRLQARACHLHRAAECEVHCPCAPCHSSHTDTRHLPKLQLVRSVRNGVLSFAARGVCRRYRHKQTWLRKRLPRRGSRALRRPLRRLPRLQPQHLPQPQLQQWKTRTSWTSCPTTRSTSR